MFVLYEVLLYLVFIVGLPFFLIIGLVRGKYVANFGERMGFYRSPQRAHDLWIHAVSVGEALAAKTIVERIVKMRPETTIVFTTTTITGQAQAKRLYPNATVTYFPFDFGFSVRRFLTHHVPRAFATMETELWPNVTRIGRSRGVRLLLANGRISDRSFPRYRFFRPVVARLLKSYERVLAREQLDRDRFLAIGAHDVEVTGNVKFDYTPHDAPLPDVEALINNRKCVVLGSTFEGEDEMLLPEVERLIRERNLFFVIAPRKPERFDAVASLLAKSRFVRRSQFQQREADILLLDTIGELARVYRYATVAFVGGSLVPHGGHNPIEPAAAGVPVCFGPHMTAFRDVAKAFLTNDAARQVTNANEFAQFVEEMTEDDAIQKAWGARAMKVVAENRGASERTARRIVELLS
ncbi:MAG TPA: 3-deoxy-D-manno-octulosonic acid transferase [Thermoanaerobaculia bacterium]|jgi:3-deoxy-D-manno-octulosonic-acid transferase|nr:3-deoxy-D-manno-octulosonic acid transferase [Thermoanaerobaculia bacterium]